MAAKRDALLSQLGISQYQLRRPRVLQGEVAVHLPERTVLLIVSDQDAALQQALVQDVLRTLALSAEQVSQLSARQLAMLPTSSGFQLWFLGVTPPQEYADNAWVSPDLDKLIANPVEKRRLWQQMSNYD